MIIYLVKADYGSWDSHYQSNLKTFKTKELAET